MIDIFADDLISLSDLPSRIPSGHGNKKIAVATVRRWATKGINGVVLDSMIIGSRSYTTPGAFALFCNKIAEVKRKGRAAAAKPQQAGDATLAALDASKW